MITRAGRPRGSGRARGAADLAAAADLVAAAKARPGELKFAFVGAGSSAYFAAERFAAAAGLNVQPVAYPSPIEALNALTAGSADFYFVPLPAVQSLIAQHKVVPLAVTTPYRLADLVDVAASA